jgi:hypothetical protein
MQPNAAFKEFEAREFDREKMARLRRFSSELRHMASTAAALGYDPTYLNLLAHQSHCDAWDIQDALAARGEK